ncbi:MAG: hypothetical protein R3E01_06885 [Pirellulaceae bacterium]|nr:hypothetical protein [Planctomycetales bacterium]
MVIRGRIKNGVIVLDDAPALPEGAEVTVVVRTGVATTTDTRPEEKQEKLREALKRFESLPNENPGDAFSGADHDRVLYGDE